MANEEPKAVEATPLPLDYAPPIQRRRFTGAYDSMIAVTAGCSIGLGLFAVVGSLTCSYPPLPLYLDPIAASHPVKAAPWFAYIAYFVALPIVETVCWLLISAIAFYGAIGPPRLREQCYRWYERSLSGFATIETLAIFGLSAGRVTDASRIPVFRADRAEVFVMCVLALIVNPAIIALSVRGLISRIRILMGLK